MTFVVFTLLFSPGNRTRAESSGPEIHTARQVHDLQPAMAAKAHADFEGVVTYYDPSEKILFVQDRTGGVFINVNRSYPIKPDDLVRVRGSLKPGYRTEVAPDVQLHRLGSGYPIDAVDVDYATLATGQVDSRLVRISGTVRDAVIESHPGAHSETLHMDLAFEGGEAEAYVEDHTNLNPLDLLGKKISLTGVAGGAFNAREQVTGVILYAHNSGDVFILGQDGPAYKTLPAVSPDEVFPSLRFHDVSPRLRIHGTILYFAPGESAFVEHDGTSIFVQTRQTGGVRVGDVVDVYGFPDNRSYSPSLRQAVLISTGDREEIAPTRILYKDGMSGLYSDRLVTLEGRVLSQLRSREADSITLEVEGHVVRGLIQDATRMPDLRLDSTIQLSGICRIVSGGPWRQPTIFFLSVRSASDVVVIHAPPWWNVRHLAELLSLLLLISLITMIWAILLRRRVARQAAHIERSMASAEKRSAILKKISSNAPLEHVLTSIAVVVQELLPEATCTFSLLESGEEMVSGPSAQKLFSCLLRENGEIIGNFAILGFPSSSSDSAYQEVFWMVDELLAIAMRNFTMHKQLIHRSTHDPLTELANRRLCETRIEEAITEARTHGACFSLIYVDVNQFKRVNDEYGHRVGDLYLQSIGKRLVGSLRSECTVARVGGDEFVVILPKSSEEEARITMRRLLDCFASPFSLGSIVIAGSASFGLACFPRHGETKDELEQHADIAMYAAKREHSVLDPLFEP